MNFKTCPDCNETMSLLTMPLPEFRPTVEIPTAWHCFNCPADWKIEGSSLEQLALAQWRREKDLVAVLRELEAAKVTTPAGERLIAIDLRLSERIAELVADEGPPNRGCYRCGENRAAWFDRRGRRWCAVCVEIALYNAELP